MILQAEEIFRYKLIVLPQITTNVSKNSRVCLLCLSFEQLLGLKKNWGAAVTPYFQVLQYLETTCFNRLEL